MAAAARFIPSRAFSTLEKHNQFKWILRDLCKLSTASERRQFHRGQILSGPPKKPTGKGRNAQRNGGGKTTQPPITPLVACPSCCSCNTISEVYGGSPKFVKCLNCGDLFKRLEKEEEVEDTLPALTPKLLKEKLDQYVIGQEMPKIEMATAVFHHYKRVKSNDQYKSRSSTVAFSGNHAKTRGNSLIDKLGIISLNDGTTQKVAEPTVVVDKKSEFPKVVMEKCNMLLLGPSGSGKTLLVQTIAKMLNVPFASWDCTNLTSAGYVGENVDAIMSKLLSNAEGDVQKCERGIVFLDEIDKIARSVRPHGKDIGGEGVQQALLKMIEGTVMSLPKPGHKRSFEESVKIDTTNILFIGAGAFTGLEKLVKQRKDIKHIGFGAPVAVDAEEKTENTTPMDLFNSANSMHQDNNSHYKEIDLYLKDTEDCDILAYGIIPELLGRMPKLVLFHSLDVGMLIRILTESKNALVKQYQHSFAIDNVELEVEPGALEAIAELALKKGTGARGLRSELERCLQSAMFEIPGSDIERVILTEDVVRNKAEPIFIRQEQSELDVDVLNADTEVANITSVTNNNTTPKL